MDTLTGGDNSVKCFASLQKKVYFKFFSFKADPFSERDLCSGKQIGKGMDTLRGETIQSQVVVFFSSLQKGVSFKKNCSSGSKFFSFKADPFSEGACSFRKTNRKGTV